MSGDTLYGIAKKFNTSVDDIMKLNNLTSNLLKVGNELLIPSIINQYIVKSGDTLYKISKLFNKSVDDIKLLNNLNSDVLTIGQILNI